MEDPASVTRSGHVHVHDDASISGGVAIHHFATIGSFSFTGGLSRVLHVVPPYMLCEGNPSRPRTINIVALKRHDFSMETIEALSEAHRLLYRSKVGLDHAREKNLTVVPQCSYVAAFVKRHAEYQDLLAT